MVLPGQVCVCRPSQECVGCVVLFTLPWMQQSSFKNCCCWRYSCIVVGVCSLWLVCVGGVVCVHAYSVAGVCVCVSWLVCVCVCVCVS